MNKKISITFKLLIIIIFLSCQEKLKFSKSGWSKKEDTFYTERIKMTDDLIYNYLSKDYCYKDIKQLLGIPEEHREDGSSLIISYEVETKYGSNIDPLWIKYLEIELNQDSCFQEARVIKLN